MRNANQPAYGVTRRALKMMTCEAKATEFEGCVNPQELRAHN